MQHQKKGYLRRGRIENDVIGCPHCSGSIVIPPGQTTRLDRCGACHKTICRTCAETLARTLKCRVWEQKMEQMERRAALMKAAGV